MQPVQLRVVRIGSSIAPALLLLKAFLRGMLQQQSEHLIAQQQYTYDEWNIAVT